MYMQGGPDKVPDTQTDLSRHQTAIAESNDG